MNKKIASFAALLLIFSTLAYSAPRSSSRSSSSRSSSSRSSSSSKPSSRPSSRPSSPSTSRPSSSKPATTPSTRPSTRPSSPSTSKPPTSSTKPSSPSVKPTSPSTKPNPPAVNPNGISSKPNTSTFDSASTAQKKQESKNIFQASNPKPVEKPITYTSKTGKSYSVDKTAPATKTIQSTVSPQEHAQRTTRVEHHYHHNYGNRYDYYRNQPYIDVGGGYSALFWYAMMDWSLDRRAMWLYNNQNTINANLYNEQLKNEALRLEVEKLKAKNAQIDPNYIDPEFKENPDLMYSEEYVDAVVKPKDSGISWVWVFVWIIFAICLISGIYLVFFKDWKVEGY